MYRQELARLLLATGAGLLTAALVGCAASPPLSREAAAVQSAWVEAGPHPQVRAVVAAGAQCPAVQVDGQSRNMALRVAAGTAATRPAAASPSKPSVFDVGVCEADLPAGARAIRIGDRALAPIKAGPQRIIVLGDTGCRISAATAQPCNDAARWPFAQVAARAAAMAPDLVIHVGDYHYREAPCPAQAPGCAGSPWGYGWDSWKADFFDPAAPLLAAAPWVFLRGNHEECSRAGQGWFRLLAPEPYAARRSCDDPANDDEADFSEPYAVSLGRTLQLIVFDSARAGNRPLRKDNAKDELTRSRYLSQLRAVTALAAAPHRHSWFASHHPVLAFAPDPAHPGSAFPGNPALQQTLREVNGDSYFAPGVQLAMHGHVHWFEAIAFASGHAPTLVAGNGGDDVDIDLPISNGSPAPGAQMAQITQSNTFGFLLLQRGSADQDEWALTAFRADGSVLTRCELAAAGALRCEPSGWIR